MGDGRDTSTAQLQLMERMAVALEGILIQMQTGPTPAVEPIGELTQHPKEQRRTAVLWAMRHDKRATSIRQLAEITGIPDSTLQDWDLVREFYGLEPKAKRKRRPK